MSDSDRRTRPSIGLKRWLWPSIIFAVAVLASGGILQWNYHQEASRNAASYARDAQNQIATECRMPVATQSCERDIQQSRRQNQREEYDLYAQKAMALWTALMGAMAVIGVALSGIGVFLIWRTWDATREAADSSRRTLSSFIAKERAILRPLQALGGTGGKRGRHTGVYIKVRNIGPTAATIISTSWQVDEEGTWKGVFNNESKSRVLVPSEGDAQSPFIELPKRVTEPVWLFGIFTYETLQSEIFETNFAFELAQYDNYGDVAWSSKMVTVARMPDDT